MDPVRQSLGQAGVARRDFLRAAGAAAAGLATIRARGDEQAVPWVAAEDASTSGGGAEETPPAWQILPIPRWADYGSPDSYLPVGRAAIVRRDPGPYVTTRDAAGELSGGCIVVEEELAALLSECGVHVVSEPDDSDALGQYDTLFLIGPPRANAVAGRFLTELGLSFDVWPDPDAPGEPVVGWEDLGREGYVLLAGRWGERNVVLLAGNDVDGAAGRFHGAGTFYAFQSFRQLLVADGGEPRVKTAVIVDKPLLAVRGCMTGYGPSLEEQWRCLAMIPRMKINQNIWWVGNTLLGYNAGAAARFRYPWASELLALFAEVGRYCRERFITLNFCFNPDYYSYAWGTALSYDGTRRDPLHYNPDHEVEPEFRAMWADLGYDVRTDVDILAAKFHQANDAAGGGSRLQIWNEDDLHELVHEDDRALYNTQTGDPRQDATNYGRARGLLLARLYRRVREMCPDSDDAMVIVGPHAMHYQLIVEANEWHCRDFLMSLGKTLADEGVLEKTPIMTSGGGTAAETVTVNNVQDYSRWFNNGPVQLHDNNFATFHLGAYETDPDGPRSLLQKSTEYPAGYRDRELYAHVWGICWNGLGDGAHLLGWCQSQFMWNMRALNRDRVNALAVRKICSSEGYPTLKRFVEEYDAPACYLQDEWYPAQILAVSDTVRFPGEGDRYTFVYTHAMRRECQRLRRDLTAWLPELRRFWVDPMEEKRTLLSAYGDETLAFCTVYLARGYACGWDGSDAGEDALRGAALRDLFLEAEDLQQRLFAGPTEAPGKPSFRLSFYGTRFMHLFAPTRMSPAPESPSEAAGYVDLWRDALLNTHFAPVSTVALADVPDGDPSLAGAWGPAEQVGGERCRRVAGEASLHVGPVAYAGRVLLRAVMGTDAATREQGTRVTLSVGDAAHVDAVCRPRPVTWLLPEGVSPERVTVSADGPVCVYEVSLYGECGPAAGG